MTAAAELLNNPSADGDAAVQQWARSMLDAAAFLYPGTDVTLLRAQLAENERHYVRPKRRLVRAAAVEPNNLAVWVAYLKLRLLDPSVGNRKLVFERLHYLDPIDIYIPRSR